MAPILVWYPESFSEGFSIFFVYAILSYGGEDMNMKMCTGKVYMAKVVSFLYFWGVVSVI